MKDTPAPPLYWAAIPTHDPRSKKNRVPVLFPFSLPHEMIYIFLQMRRPLCASMGELPASVAATLQTTARSLKTTTDGLLPIGFHGDAAPNQAHGSVLCFSWNILNTPDSERFLCTAIQSDFLCQCGCGGRCTIDAIVRVFVWSANTAFTGSFPASRHDTTPWGSSFDRWRKALANNALGSRALLQPCQGGGPGHGTSSCSASPVGPASFCVGVVEHAKMANTVTRTLVSRPRGAAGG